jgi:hypothetical protein
MSIRERTEPPYLLFNGSIITSRLYSFLSAQLYTPSLIHHIQRKANWSPSVFNMLDWDAHGSAFQCLSHQQKLFMAKLIYQLINISCQNHLFYGPSNLCPCCGVEEMTLAHLLLCSDNRMASARITELEALITSLSKIGTPSAILDSITNGFKAWISNNTGTVWASSAGQLGAAAALLTTAFHEQFHSIGWFHFQLGCLSKHWGKAYRDLTPHATDRLVQCWVSAVIFPMWKYIGDNWSLHNKIVHGATVEDQACIILEELHEKVWQYYSKFQDNPNFIPQSQHHLFTDRTLNQCLHHSYDPFLCWIRSMEEAFWQTSLFLASSSNSTST